VKVREVMTPIVEVLAPDATAQAAAQTLAELDVRALPVGTREQLEGMLTEHDIVIRVVAEGRDPASTLVRDIMSTGFAACAPEDAAEEVANEMERRQIRRMPVLEDGHRLVGMVSLDSIFRAGAAGAAQAKPTQA
jgi:CBS domain-containing protein